MMEIDMDKRHWEHGPCPKHDCRKDSCKCGLRLISFPAALGDDSKGSPVAPKNGDYCNALVKYESNGHMYVYSTEGVPERLSSNGTLNFEELLNRPQYNGEIMTGETDIPEVPSAVSQLTNDLDFQTGEEVDSTVASAVATETTARQQADNTLQSAITGVSNALGAETTARQNADTALQNSITTVSNNLSSEVTARQNADTTIQNNVTAVSNNLSSEVTARQNADTAIQNNITTVSNNLSSETTARQNADNNLQSQIDGISASSDVKDVVGTYAELQAYDTSTLGNNDIIKVLQDEAHSDETTYYRWSTTTQTFTLIGEEGPYYTKSATDTLLNTKADKATTYTKTEVDNITGSLTNLTTTDKTNLVAAINEVETLNYRTPYGIGVGNNIVWQYEDPDYNWGNVVVGDDTAVYGPRDTVIGTNALTDAGDFCTAVGYHSFANSSGETALGAYAYVTNGHYNVIAGSVAVGGASTDEGAHSGSDVIFSVGSAVTRTLTETDPTGYTYTITLQPFTRRIVNVTDPIGAHDAATKGYVDTAVAGAGESMVVENVTGTTPTITAESSHIYICGTVDTLNFTPSATGVCEVIFTSGATPTTLVVPNTVRMPDWFVVQPNSTYEISIFNGIYGAVTVWNQ